MSFKERMLSKSNSYNFYKDRTEQLLKENEELKKELEELKLEKQTTLRDELFKLYPNSLGFCNWNYMSCYFSDDFEEKLMNVTKNLDEKNKIRYKWYLLRVLAINVMKKDSLFFKHELKNQEEYLKFRQENSGPNEIAGYTFYGQYNLHPFINLNLNTKDRNYIRDKDIIDAGAFTGDTSIPLSDITNKNVYAFEPFDESFELLEKNIKANNIENIVPVKKSLGNRNGERSLYLTGHNFQGITTNPDARDYDQEIKVEEVTIDKFVEENNLDVGYITVDVEGAELDLLAGALNTLKAQRPILNISIYHKVSDFFEIIPWIANLDLEYEFNLLKEQPWPFLADTVVQCRPK